MITTKNGITMETGQEGPLSDPYDYTEFMAMSKEDVPLMLHCGGLVTWIKLGDGPKLHEIEGKTPEQYFEEQVGRTLSEIEEDLLSPKCPNHPDAEIDYATGHPGESFAVCSVCGNVLDMYFNKSAVI